ncbi:hypothetical protein FBU30_009376 [Linnemannia zychae]|nr:hypothetical protein FBU30_009376 [Linnemannia zychae]
MTSFLAIRFGTALRQRTILNGRQQADLMSGIFRTSVISSVSKLINPAISTDRATANFSTTSGIHYAKRGRPGPNEGYTVNFIMQDGEEISVQAHEGESLLDVAWANDIDIEDPESFSKLEEPTDEENDMLDLAFGLTDTSRLGCQVLMNKELDGIIAKLPAMTRNASA